MPSVNVNDISVYYELHGEGEPLVLITGLANDVTQYGHIIALLSRHNRVLAFDNRGAGRTDKPDEPYSMEQMATDTAGLMEALDIMQAHVVGISMGGRIALALALQRPEMVRSLVLASTFARNIPPTGRMPKHIASASRYPQPEYAFYRQLVASRSYDFSDRLGRISVPTLVLHGRNDMLVPAALAEEVQAGIAGSRMEIFDGGHLFFMTAPERFAKAILEFLTP
jgi:3-oxoadipate enol-lactonase